MLGLRVAGNPQTSRADSGSGSGGLPGSLRCLYGFMRRCRSLTGLDALGLLSLLGLPEDLGLSGLLGNSHLLVGWHRCLSSLA